MISIRIAEEERKIEDAEESWINRQINRRRAGGESVCVLVMIHVDSLHLVLKTPGCPQDGGGGRAPNPHENKVIELWDKRGLNAPAFTGGNLVAFLRQLTQLI